MPARKKPSPSARNVQFSSDYSKLTRRRFGATVVRWQLAQGRHDLPWQSKRSAYRVWLSEVMLQQTQVTTVIPYFKKFTAQFDDVSALADAPQDQVMQLWSGLGYYSRARNLHRCARIVRDQYGGVFPDDFEALQSLPGIGRSTAAAIAVFAFGQRQAIMDGNVKRVFCRYFGVSEPVNKSATIAALWDLADRHLPKSEVVAYTQGLMDLGATCCTRSRPSCDRCPVRKDCFARLNDCTAQLPARVRKKPVQHRRTTMLVIVDTRSSPPAVFVRKRPDAGIWGGLYCLPESAEPVNRSIDAHLLSALLLPVRDSTGPGAGLPERVTGQPLEPLDHAFTHFKLHIEPLFIGDDTVVRMLRRRSDDAASWLAMDQVDSAALPAPVKTLLSALRGGQLPASDHIVLGQEFQHE